MTLRDRPNGWPVACQHWRDLLFLHWPMPENELRRLVPAELDIDTFDGSGWISLSPLRIWGTRPSLLPAPPIIGNSLELNVRTYVVRDGVPGVWFLSLDASNPLAVVGARAGFSLPYYFARMKMWHKGEPFQFHSRRFHPGGGDAHFAAEWTEFGPAGELMPGTLDFFLVERYCLYAQFMGRLYRGRIHHRPWLVRQAALRSLASNMIQANGLPAPKAAPILHAQAEPLSVEIWREHRV